MALHTQPRPQGARAHPLDQVVDVETPEQVVFSYSIAGVGTRAAAALLDLLLITIATLFLFLVVAVLVAALSVEAMDTAMERVTEGWAIAIILMLQFLATWGYHVLFEGFRDGQTPGKKALRIRVVRDGGYSVSLGESAIRNIVRVVDMMPPVTYAVGMLAIVFNRSGKRIGDMVAGTMVVRERVVREQLPEVAPRSASIAVTATLSEPEYQLLEQVMGRLSGMEEQARNQLIARLADRLAAHLPPGARNSRAALRELFEMERLARASGMAARGDTGAARERHAIVHEGAERWQRFASRLEEVQRRGLRRLSEEEVSGFVAEYREVATDLARLRTATGGAMNDDVFHLSRLVAAGHNLLYQRGTMSLRAAARYLTVRVPSEVRRSARPIVAAALLLFVPMAITFALVSRDLELAERILPEMMFDRAEEGVVRGREGGYLVISAAERPVLAAQVMTNNIQVTFLAFALGITAAVGTALLLVSNGIGIGAAVGLYANMGVASLILDFVIPHGVFELTAICIAGGAGFVLGKAILLPGALDRQSALKQNGRRAIDLMVAAILMLVFAGLIEGLISPRPELPAGFRYGVATVSAAIIIGYLLLGRGEEAEVAVAQSDERALISR